MKKGNLNAAVQLMGILNNSDTQELIRLRSMIDEELIERKFDLTELKINRRQKYIKFIHWLKYGVWR